MPTTEQRLAAMESQLAELRAVAAAEAEARVPTAEERLEAALHKIVDAMQGGDEVSKAELKAEISTIFVQSAALGIEGRTAKGEELAYAEEELAEIPEPAPGDTVGPFPPTAGEPPVEDMPGPGEHETVAPGGGTVGGTVGSSPS